jgi:molybdopterin molybdotransferase
MTVPTSRADAPLLDAAAARALLAQAWPELGSEIVALADAVGRTLAAPVVSREDLPAFTRSAMDGHAVRADATAGATADAPVALVLGQLAWPIVTGGPVPAAADAVIVIEQTSTRGRPDAAELLVTAPIAAGRNITARGDDVRSGDTLAPAGHRLTPIDLALLAAVGVTSVTVVRRPRVAVLSSGAELVAPGADVPPGKVRDVNQLALVAAVRATGAVLTAAGIVSDEPAAIAAALARLAPSHDVILMTGGTSVGVADHTAPALQQAGARPLFHGLAVRPGRPTLAAVLGDSLVVGLPGVPAAAAVIYAAFVRPLLGADDRMVARLTVDVASVTGREDLVRVALEPRADGLWAAPLGGPPSSLRALATAAGVAVVPSDLSALPAGACITVIRL